MRYSQIEIAGELVNYTPLAPVADTQEMADEGPRLMFRHGHQRDDKSQFWIAPTGEFSSGWVIGKVWDREPRENISIRIYRGEVEATDGEHCVTMLDLQ